MSAAQIELVDSVSGLDEVDGQLFSSLARTTNVSRDNDMGEYDITPVPGHEEPTKTFLQACQPSRKRLFDAAF